MLAKGTRVWWWSRDMTFLTGTVRDFELVQGEQRAIVITDPDDRLTMPLVSHLKIGMVMAALSNDALEAADMSGAE